MSALIIGLYGIFLLLVGLSSNSSKLISEVKTDAGGFLPWAISIGVLATLYEIPQTKKLAGPFLLLLALTFVVRNFETLKTQFAELSKLASSKVTQ